MSHHPAPPEALQVLFVLRAFDGTAGPGTSALPFFPALLSWTVGRLAEQAPPVPRRSLAGFARPSIRAVATQTSGQPAPEFGSLFRGPGFGAMRTRGMVTFARALFVALLSWTIGRLAEQAPPVPRASLASIARPSTEALGWPALACGVL